MTQKQITKLFYNVQFRNLLFTKKSTTFKNKKPLNKLLRGSLNTSLY